MSWLNIFLVFCVFVGWGGTMYLYFQGVLHGKFHDLKVWLDNRFGPPEKLPQPPMLQPGQSDVDALFSGNQSGQIGNPVGAGVIGKIIPKKMAVGPDGELQEIQDYMQNEQEKNTLENDARQEAEQEINQEINQG